METKGVLHDRKAFCPLVEYDLRHAAVFENDGTCVDMIVKTENNPYVNDQYAAREEYFYFFPEETVQELKPALEQVAKKGRFPTPTIICLPRQNVFLQAYFINMTTSTSCANTAISP